jgi:hypothetical protein
VQGHGGSIIVEHLGDDVSTMTAAKLSETIGVEMQGVDAERLVEHDELPRMLLDLLDRRATTPEPIGSEPL